MNDKTKPALFAAFTEATRPPAPPTAVRVAPPAKPRPAKVAAEPAPPRQAKHPRGQGERITLTYRLTTPNWERLKHLAINDRVSIQDADSHRAFARVRAARPPSPD